MVLRGILAVLFGIMCFAWPGITLAALVLLYGVYALVDGVFALVSALVGRPRTEPWWVLTIEGLVGIAVGIATFAWPGITALVLLFLIAAWAIFTGVLQIVAAIRLRREIQGEWLLGLSGLLSVLFGVALVIRPGAGALAVIWLIGAYSIAFGGLGIALGFRLRSWLKHGIDSMVNPPRVEPVEEPGRLRGNPAHG
ncbi:HdeD family acid-resistance protein [Singulisphaera sp. Ch08]|uniref:HdeD family acid-resistance protein n=1 Tax=Singulisphaera sp. Ch08 TaxID=3120278 RepID=A0AAU7CEC7_9BACT